MAVRVQKVSGAFEKQAPELWQDVIYILSPPN